MNQGAQYQLIAYGTEDLYLYGNPSITYFKYVYLKHTIFQKEEINLNFFGEVNFGSKNTCTIGKNGDLLSKVWLVMNLPRITSTETGASGNGYWIPFVGHALIKTVELEIGKYRIDKQYGQWMQIWYELTTPTQKRDQGDKMLGEFTSESQQIYVPLQFWFCRYQDQPLPLIALQYNDVKINVEFASLNELYVTDDYTDENLIVINSDQNQDIKLSAYLIAEYIHLSNEERHLMASSSHEYLIEQLQYNGQSESSDKTSSMFLKFTNPIKEIFWVSQKQAQQQVVKNFNKFNFTDIALEKKQDTDLSLPLSVLTPRDFQNPYYTRQFTGLVNGIVETRNIVVSGNNPSQNVNLIFDGQSRITNTHGDYFNYLQPYEYHTGSTRKGINVYSFCQNPEQYQPSGSCNFAKLDNPRLVLTYSNEILNRNNTENWVYVQQLNDYVDFTEDLALTYIYAIGYNVIKIVSGICTLVFPN